MIEGSVPRTNGSRSGRPKNIRIQIRNLGRGTRPRYMVLFWQEYFREEWRGYGASVAEVFFKLKGNDRSVPYVGFPGAGSVLETSPVR